MAEVRKGDEEIELQATAHLKRNVTPTLQGVPDIMLDTEPLTTQLIETGLEENPFKAYRSCVYVWVCGGWVEFRSKYFKGNYRFDQKARKGVRRATATKHFKQAGYCPIPSFTCESDVSKTGDIAAWQVLFIQLEWACSTCWMTNSKHFG